MESTFFISTNLFYFLESKVPTTIPLDFEDLPEVDSEQELDDINVSPFQMRRAKSRRKKEEIAQKKIAKNAKRRAVKEFILTSEKHAKFYTGLMKPHHEALWNLLGDARSQLSILNSKKTSGQISAMCLESQFLMTLYILRRDRAYMDVALQFNISHITISRIFKTWLMFIYKKFKDIEGRMFTKKQDLMKPLPAAFKNPLLKETRVVIDCTEIPLESAINYKNQGNIYSSYKSRATAKVLIGVNPHGGAVFVSDAYEGSISDYAITKDSGNLQFTLPWSYLVCLLKNSSFGHP